MYGCRCNEKLKAKTEGSTSPTYTGFRESWDKVRSKKNIRDVRGCFIFIRIKKVETRGKQCHTKTMMRGK